MKIDSKSLKNSLKRQKTKEVDIIDKCFNRGIETAIKVVELYERAEILAKEVKYEKSAK